MRFCLLSEGGIGIVCLHGGYKTQTVTQLGNLLTAFDNKQITFRGLRLYFAALAAVAAREAAERTSDRRGRRGVRYRTDELAAIAAMPVEQARRELRRLERAGLLHFNESAICFRREKLAGAETLTDELSCGRSPARPVPLPRTAIRFMARSSRIATIKTMIAYCVRGMSIARTGEVRGRGTAKALWIARVCGLSLRAVRLSRAELIDLKFISRDAGSKQWKLNRDGAYFLINGEFGAGDADEQTSRAKSASSFAPRNVEICVPFAPPYEDMKTPSGSKDQETRSRERAGVRRMSKLKSPNFFDVQQADLKSVSRMTAMHEQAVTLGLARGGEAGRIEFLAAALHAANAGTRNAPGLFVALVRRGLWHHITQAEEDRARRAIARASLGRTAIVAKMPGRECGPDPATKPLHVAALLGSIANQLPSEPAMQQ
jgi:hypothetical protein